MDKATTTTLCITTLLLLLAFSHHVLARPGPTFHDVTPMETHHGDNKVPKVAVDQDSCVGLREDECMMKRTIEARLDYIFTQKKQQP